MGLLPNGSSEFFSEAVRFWNLADLYADLSTFCDSPLSDRDKTYLRGILCGYGVGTMAKLLNVEASTIRVSYLNRRLYPALRALLESHGIEAENHRQLVKVLPKLLEQAGYRIAATVRRSALALDGVPEVPSFHGRSPELAILHDWIVDQGCRLVDLYGLVGVGKTTLAAQFVRTAAHDFDRVCWRSLRTRPPLPSLLECWLRSLSDRSSMNPDSVQADSLDGLLTQLFDVLRQQRCLLVVDDIHTLLTTGEHSRQFHPDYDAYGELIRKIVTEPHRSTLMLLGWETPAELTRLGSTGSDLRRYQVGGLSCEAAYGVLCDALGSELMEEVPRVKWDVLIQAYEGHPLPLIVVAKAIVDTGCLHSFFRTQFLGEYDYWLGLVYERLSPLERQVLQHFSYQTTPLSIDDLVSSLQKAYPSIRASEVIQANLALQERSLILRDLAEHPPTFSILPLMKKYIQVYQPIESVQVS